MSVTDEKMLNRLNLNISNCMEKVLDPENFLSYIRVVHNFPTFDYRNHLLIWRQCPKASYLISKTAADMEGIGISPDSQQIAIMYPSITIEEAGKLVEINGVPQVDAITNGEIYEVEPQYKNEFDFGFMYAVEDSQVKSFFSKKNRNPKDIFRAIKMTGYNVIFKDASQMNTDTDFYGYVDANNKEYVINNGLSEPEKFMELIDLYVEEDNSEEEASEFMKTLKLLIKAALYDYYGLLDQTVTFPSVEIIKNNEDYKKDFFHTFSEKVSEAIMDFTGYVLTFNETAIANNLIRSSDLSDTTFALTCVKGLVKDESFRYDIAFFTEKLRRVSDEYYDKLVEAVMDKKLFTYPENVLMCVFGEQDLMTPEEMLEKRREEKEGADNAG